MSLEDELREAVGPAHVLVDPAVTASYETDWTRRFHGRALCVVRPGSTEEVIDVMKTCAAHGIPVVPQGGNTGLVGGGVPVDGEVILSTTRLRALGPVDRATGQVTVGAGVTVAALQQSARAVDLDFGVDLASRDSATIGGLVATNAGGVNVIRYGGMREQVSGIEAVLADGSVIRRLDALPKDNTGYDLAGLLPGSEGTLAIVTAVRVRLWPRLTKRAVALLALDSTNAAVAALDALRLRLTAIESAEFFLADGLALVRAHTGLAAPVPGDHAAYLLVEVAGREDPSDDLYAALEAAGEAVPGIDDVVIGADGPSRERLWRYREAHTESISAAGIPVKLDIVLPRAGLDQGLRELPDAVRRVSPAARTIMFGHLGEGNVHVNVLDADDAHAVTDAVLRYVAACGGSISAEHGIGRAKAGWLALTKSPDEIAAMRAIKRALDPHGLLNPGVILAAD